MITHLVVPLSFRLLSLGYGQKLSLGGVLSSSIVEIRACGPNDSKKLGDNPIVRIVFEC